VFWAFMAALAAVPVGVFVIRPRLAKLFDKDFQGVKIEAIVGPIITLTVFLAAFVVAQATQTYQRAGQNAIGEANAVSLLSENAGMLPDDKGQNLQAASVCYARAVHHLEWPSMESGQSSPAADRWAQTFNDEIPKILDGPGAIVGQVVGLNRTQSEMRQLRLYEASPHLPQTTILLMIVAVILVILLLSSFAIADIRRRVLVPLALALAVLLGGTLYLVEQLEEPFAGIIRVQPSLITKVENTLEKEFESRYPDVQVPCEDDGTPTA
jgi:hypothetical protein